MKTHAFVIAVLASLPLPAFAQPRAPAVPTAPRAAEDLARARVLDQQGAKAYENGRYNDAIRYFEESYRLGGPAFELWNIAKCHVRLDEPDQAAEMLERYLATPTLPVEDRDEATQQLETLRHRPSTVTIASSPAAATLTVDGRPVEGGGRTPTSFVAQPGLHSFTLAAPGYATHSQTFEARFGRAVILDVALARAEKPKPRPTANPYGDGEIRRVALRGDLGAMIPRYGSLGGEVHPSFDASATYRFVDVGATTLAAGAMFFATGDSWDNTVGADASVKACGTLRNPRSASAYSLFALASAGWELAPRVRAHALGGFGIATLSADDLGGDVFVPACHPAPSPRPALLLGGRIDFAVTPILRVSALPIVLHLQPAFDGTRTSPIDTSGVWIRATIAVGAGVDL